MRVLITYSLNQREVARELAAALRREGYQTWLDVEDLRLGEQWFRQIDEATMAADSFVVLVGPHLSLDHFQELLWQHSLQVSWNDPSRKLYPVLLDGAEMPPVLADWLPLRVERMDSLGVHKVINALQGHGGGAAPPDLEELRKRLRRVS